MNSLIHSHQEELIKNIAMQTAKMDGENRLNAAKADKIAVENLKTLNEVEKIRSDMGIVTQDGLTENQAGVVEINQTNESNG